MGCDIHVYIEKRLKTDDPWQMDENHTLDKDGHIDQVTATGRNYQLFGRLAGVRSNSGKHEPRGLPKDCTTELKEEAQGPDWHNHSWLTLSEFKECLTEVDYKFDECKSTEAFYDWNSGRDWKDLPEDYTTLVNYCEQWIANELAEAHLLNRSDVCPEVRFIFWFDN